MGKSRQLSNTSTLGVSTTLVATYDANTTSTGFLQVSIGSTAQRPSTNTKGYIRYNTTLDVLESANGTAWSNVGSGAASSGGGGISWQAVQNTNFIAVAGNGYFVNTAIANVTVTLPASPTFGQQIQFVDYAKRFSGNNLILYPNGNKIDANTSNLALPYSSMSVGLVYTDTTQGWVSYSGFASSPTTNYYIDYVVVAAGGGGGSGNGGAGGGAGGYIQNLGVLVTPGATYSLTIGAGGAVNNNGSNSTGFGQTSNGGGTGGPQGGSAGNGGSGGGAAGAGGAGTYNTSVGTGTSGQGNNGGYGWLQNESDGGGGGGGAGANGGNGGTNVGGTGGIGRTFNGTYYAGGGGGGTYVNGGNYPGGLGGGGTGGRTNGPAGTAGGTNTGGGGGGAGGTAGAGGSGVVIIRYLGNTIRGNGGSVSSANGYTVHTFTSSGTFIA
jgi:hypothetical protein